MNPSSTIHKSPPVLSIGLVSATALAYEILLMRLFSIIQWHHYAYMVISLALLGYGLSGAFLAVTQRGLLQRFSLSYLANLSLFGITSVSCFMLAQHIPFNPEEMLWDYRQPVLLFSVYLILSLPFFFAANAIALAMAGYREDISRIYAFDLIGAGIGSLAIIAILFIALPLNALYILGIVALLNTLLAAWELRPESTPWPVWARSPATAVTFALSAFIIIAWTLTHDHLQLSPYKGLSQALQVTNSRIIAERASPLGLIHVVESPVIPFRHAPGLSLNTRQEPLPQLGLFTDGGGMSVITRFPPTLDKLAYLDRLTSAAPYHLFKPQQVLVLGAGGGSAILQALYHSAPHIDAIELNPQVVKLLRKDYVAYAGNLYGRPDVQVHIADARGYITGSLRQYDLIQLALLDSFGASSAGLTTLNESYLYTVEAIQRYLQALKPNGYLVISRWINLPPRDTLKLFATAIDALEGNGMQHAAPRLLLIRSWQTSTLLIKNGNINKQEISALKQFCRENAFDLAYYPGIREQEANRYNKLQQAYFFSGTLALLGQHRQTFIDDYKFNLQPATDDRPYYFNFFKWSALPEIISLRGQGGLPLIESGYLVLIAILIQALLASLLLILLPLWVLLRREKTSTRQISHSRVIVYFSALGLAFLFIEIAVMQKFILFLHHPLYAAGVVLSSFLVFAGMGSGWSKRRQQHVPLLHTAGYAITGIVCIAVIYLLALGSLFDAMMMLPLWVKFPVAIGLIAPLAFCMGIPFPSALTRLGELAPELIPWAWGINGCASVLSAVLATLIAIHAGFSMVIAGAALLYLLAYVTFPRSSAR